MAISAEDKNFLVSLYVGYFNRAPDPAGLQFWIDQVEAGRDTNTIAADFAASPEAKSLYPFLTTPDVSSPTSFITAVYANLFNRTPDAAGQAFWEAQLSSGAVSPADAIDAIIKGAATAPDSTILANKNAVGLDFATDAGNTPGFTFDLNGSSGSAAKSAISGVTEDASTVVAAQAATDAYLNGVAGAGAGETFTLTTGADALTGSTGIDKFIGTEATLSSADALDGGAGTDTLKYASSGTAAVSEAGFTAANIEMVDITADAVGGTTFDVTGVSDVKTITNSNSSANLNLIGGEAVVDLELKDVSGGNTVVNYQASAVAGTADVQNVTLNDVHSNAGTAVSTLTVNGVETVSITTAGGASLLTDIVTGAQTVNVAGDQNLGITNAIAGATKIDASALTGNLTIRADSASTAKDVAVTGGAGDDTADFSNGFEAGDSFDGGAGTDTLGLTNAVATGSPAGTTSNVEQLNVTTAGTGTIDMDNFAGVSKVIYDAGIAAFGTATVDDAVTGTTVEVDVVNPGANLVVDLKTDGTADELTVALDEIAAGDVLASVNAADAETLNISADDDTANGSGTLTITSLTASDATTLKLSGDADLTIGSTVDPATAVLATVDASTATGQVSISGTNFAAGGATVTLGASDDTLNLATAAGADTITLGEGKDTVVYNALAQSSGSKVDTITDFKSGTDVVNVTALMTAGGVDTDFVGVFSSFGAAQGAIALGGNVQAVFQSDTNTLWVDANSDGTLNSNDLQIKLDGVSTITAADLGLSGGNVINLTAPGAVVNATTKTNADNMSTNGPDTFNAAFAELAGSSLTGGNGVDVLNIEDAVTAPFGLDGEISGIETVTLAKGTTAALTINDAAVVNVNVSANDSMIILGTSSANADFDFVGSAGSDNLTLEGAAYDAASSFDGNGAGDVLGLISGTNISAATVTEFETLNVAANATATLSVAQHNAFTSMIGASGTETLNLTGGGTLTGNALIESYDASGAGSPAAYDFTVGAAGQNFEGDNGSDIIRTNGLTVTGTLDGDSGFDTVVMTNGGNVSGATLTSISQINLTGNGTLSSSQANTFLAGLQGTGTNTVTLTDNNSAVNSALNTSVETLDINNNDGNTITVNAGAQNVDLGTGNDTLNLNGGTYTGTLDGEAGADTIVFGATSDVSGATISGFTNETTTLTNNVNLVVTDAQFDAIIDGATLIAAGTNTVSISDNASIIVDGATTERTIENFTLSSAGNDSIEFVMANANTTQNSVNIAAGGNDSITLNNATIEATEANDHVTITGFTAGSGDKVSSEVGGTAHNAGFQTVTAASSGLTVGANSIVEIETTVASAIDLTDVADGGGIETIMLNALGADNGLAANDNLTFVIYSGSDAGLYQVEYQNNADEIFNTAADLEVELVGIVSGVGANALTSADFA